MLLTVRGCMDFFVTAQIYLHHSAIQAKQSQLVAAQKLEIQVLKQKTLKLATAHNEQEQVIDGAKNFADEMGDDNLRLQDELDVLRQVSLKILQACKDFL